MVDGERLGARLDRLEHLIERLEEIRGEGLEAYLEDEGRRAMTERWLQLAIQTCIDVGAQMLSEVSARSPSDYAGVFIGLGEAGVIDGEAAGRLAAAAGQRNVLVHAYLDVDDEEVFASLSRLDDLREFAAVAQGLADEAEARQAKSSSTGSDQPGTPSLASRSCPADSSTIRSAER